MTEHWAPCDGSGRRVGIVVSRFNELVTRQLLDGARAGLLENGVADDDIVTAWVPGAWEIPSALRRIHQAGGFHALIALGAVIRGDTPHFDYVAGGVANGVARVGEETGVPVIFGVLTTDDLEQALERAGARSSDAGGTNKGWDAALAALEMANLFDRLAG